VLFGIDAGHGTENRTLPMGVRTMLDGARRRVLFMDAAVS
jgi:muramoyltetrapeptide carboxypeptidase LdcA involved in peptidoglycan recycling